MVRQSILCGILFGALIALPCSAKSSKPGIQSELPPGWEMESLAGDARSVRFISPDRSAWLSVSKKPAVGSVPGHLRAVRASAPGDVTYMRGGQSWIVISGFNDEGRIFYKKEMLACGGTAWYEIAFEYPAAQKRAFDNLVTRISRLLSLHKRDDCG